MLKKILFLSIFLAVGLVLAFYISAGTSCPANTTVGETQATLVGDVTDDGGDPNLEVWFQYGLTTNYGSETPKVSQHGTGVFCATIKNLTPCTKYHYRAVAKNSAATSYGENKSFTTLCPISVNLTANGSDGPISVSYKSNVKLEWEAKNASYCEASGDWSGIRGVKGEQIIQMNQVKIHNFKLTCKDSSGTKEAVDSVQVHVTPNPPTVITLPAVVTH